MPKPFPHENRNQYVNRAIDYLVKMEGLSQKQAVGKAEGMADEYFGGGRKKKKPRETHNW